ncbi:MAG: 2-oxoglutarate dehydrogenase complex dihydrolipoyllysine-residue succinyltransferase [Terriglobia bacterium]
MPTKIVVPELGESILEATVGHWRKRQGDAVRPGDVVVELETDKVDLEIGAEQAGVLAKIERKEGEDVRIGDVLGLIEDAAADAGPNGAAAKPSQASQPGPVEQSAPPAESSRAAQPAPEALPRSAAKAQEPSTTHAVGEFAMEPTRVTAREMATPSARRLAREQGLDLAQVPLPDAKAREDVARYATAPAKPAEHAQRAPDVPSRSAAPGPREERVRMSRRRQTIAQRLVEAQRTAAILTTFNEIDMSAMMALRERQKESFKARYGVSLGITSFFVKAAVAALRRFPSLNAEVEGAEIIIKRYYDIGVAVGAAEGLVVPVLRNADQMSFAEIELAVKDYARKAREGALALADLRGGTFSVTNGGVFGSLLSTPILNPPQSGILGLHKVEERPIAVKGEVKVRPMMYVALSYDHRIVDGLEAVQFLVRIKELIEDPGSLLIES